LPELDESRYYVSPRRAGFIARSSEGRVSMHLYLTLQIAKGASHRILKKLEDLDWGAEIKQLPVCHDSRTLRAGIVLFHEHYQVKQPKNLTERSKFAMTARPYKLI
jgi:hypothetical protein